MAVSTPSSTLKEFISTLDVSAVGVVNLSNWQGTRLEDSARRLLPSARSVVVMAMEFYREVLDLASPGRITGEASLNELMAATTDYLDGELTRAAFDVAGASRRLGFRALPLPAEGGPLDTRFLRAVFSYKHAAEASGIGAIGKSSLLVNQPMGPRMRLSCCLTEAPLEPTVADRLWKCAGCRICIDRCPSGAISEPPSGEAYAIDRFACSSFLE